MRGGASIPPAAVLADPPPPASRLQELTRPFFTAVARLHREARRGMPLELDPVRREITNAFASMRNTVASEAALAAQYRRIEPALVFFIDYLVKEGPFPFARDWREMAFDIGEGAGDEKFFDLLDACIDDPGDEAQERLWVFHECLVQGFDGVHRGDPKEVQRRMKLLAQRLGLDARRDSFPIAAAPAAGVRPRFRRPALRWRIAVAALVVALAGLALFNVLSYRSITETLRGALDRIIEQSRQDFDTAGRGG